MRFSIGLHTALECLSPSLCNFVDLSAIHKGDEEFCQIKVNLITPRLKPCILNM